MNPVHVDFRSWQLRAVAAFCLLSGMPYALAAEAGIVKTVKGSAQIERQGGISPARVGDSVEAGDRVRVVGEGSIGISLKDETLLSLGPNGVAVIDAYQYDPTTRDGKVETSVLKGSLRFVTGLIGKANPRAIKVTTPTATIGIRGTDFIVEVPDEQ